MNDEILNSALGKMYEKYQAGVEEHGGRGLADADLSVREFIVMIMEEAIDTVMYCEGLLQKMDAECSSSDQGVKETSKESDQNSDE